MQKIGAPLPNEDFLEAFGAARGRIEDAAAESGARLVWIRSEPLPPFLEHLSFSVGEKVYAVRLTGVPDAPGTPAGLSHAALGLGAQMCVMPMRNVGRGWESVNRGWGLLDAMTGKAVDPALPGSHEEIPFSDWELNAFALEAVKDRLRESGARILSACADPEVFPSLWYEENGEKKWVVAHALRGGKDAPRGAHGLSEALAELRGAGFSGDEVSVVFYGAGPESSPAPLLRGGDFSFYFSGSGAQNPGAAEEETEPEKPENNHREDGALPSEALDSSAKEVLKWKYGIVPSRTLDPERNKAPEPEQESGLHAAPEPESKLGGPDGVYPMIDTMKDPSIPAIGSSVSAGAFLTWGDYFAVFQSGADSVEDALLKALGRAPRRADIHRYVLSVYYQSGVSGAGAAPIFVFSLGSFEKSAPPPDGMLELRRYEAGGRTDMGPLPAPATEKAAFDILTGAMRGSLRLGASSPEILGAASEAWGSPITGWAPK